MDYSDDDVLPAEVNETIEAKSVFVTYSILPETQVEEMGGNEVPKRKGILLRMFRSKEERRRAMLNEEGEHVVIEIPVTTQNIIYAIVSYYVIFHTKYVTNLMNSMKDHVGFSIPKTIIFVLFNLIMLFVPVIHQIKDLLKLNKDMVDFTPEGFLGDVWLCIYYFFATFLPWNWGPRVFRK
ncbi:hypothetical protein WA171_004622 [Blastocystis sp. BT1]